MSQSFFQTSRDDLLRPKDLSSQQFIPSGHHLQPLPLPVTSLEGLCQAPRGNGLIYCFLKDRDDAYPGCTLWDEKANKGKETASIRERFSVMFVLQQAEPELSIRAGALLHGFSRNFPEIRENSFIILLHGQKTSLN